jgi:8-oxo-dGTP pyrophosphatase MutT (NUDIX family)
MDQILGRLLQRGHVGRGDLKACGAVIYAKDTHRVLFLLRNGDKHQNTWALAGGKAEGNETVTQALYRELSEEVGLDATDLKIMPLELFTSKDSHFEYHTFVCLVAKEFVPQLNNEHKGYAWCAVDSFPKPLHPGLWSSWTNKEIRKKLETIKQVLVSAG